MNLIKIRNKVLISLTSKGLIRIYSKMSLKNIIIEPDPILRKTSNPIEKVDSTVRKLLDDMFETMYKAPGIGLAAVQVGILKRLVVLDVSKKRMKKKIYLFDKPKNISKSKNGVQLGRKVVYLYLDILLKSRDPLNV